MAVEITEELKRQMDVLSERFAPEELCEELKPYISETISFTMIKHPLVVYLPYSEMMNKQVNAMYFQKRKAVKEALDNKQWGSYIFLHERPFRLEAFYDIYNELIKEPKAYWEALADVWTDTEAPYINLTWWKKLFNVDLPEKKWLMNEEEQEVYKSLPDNVTIYRGVQNKKYPKGISYTLDIDKATWFSKRFNGDGAVLKAEVKKKDIAAFLNGRNEQEIVVTKSIKTVSL